MDTEFIGLVACGVGADEGEEGGRVHCGGVCDAFGVEVGDPEDGEVLGVWNGLLEVEEGFGAGFDHGVGDEGVVGGWGIEVV